MQKQFILITMIALLIGLMTTSAQDDESSFRVWSPIESVVTSAIAVDDGEMVAWELMITGYHTDACEFDLFTEVTQYENNLDIQLYREIPITVTCLREDVPFETTVLTGMPFDEIPPYVVINDQVWEVVFPDENVLFEELTLFGAVIDDVTVTFIEAEDEDSQDRYALGLSGSHAVGCDVPLVYAVRQLAESTLVGIYNPLPELTACPAVIVILDETIEIPATLLGMDTLIAVNDYIINELETQTMSDTSKVMTNINSVTVNVMESSPMQMSIDVNGEHPDGCDYPVMIDQEKEGNDITVTIYRQVPLDVMCPMMLNPYEATIQIDGEFESGTYEITVNGVTQSVDI